MRRKEISIVVILALVLLISSVAAFSDITDPKAGTVRAKMAATAHAGDQTAHGQVVINYVKGQDKFVVQANVVKLSPETEYAVFLYPANQEIGTFTTDKKGNGRLHLTLPGTTVIGTFDRINIRIPGVGHSAELTSLTSYGGSLQQSPSSR